MLFLAKNASLARAGVTVMADMDLEFDAPRAALVGDWTPLFDLLRGRAELVAGSLELAGSDARTALSQGVVGFASAEAEYNSLWTSSGYLQKVALLDTGSPTEAKRRAREALQWLGLERLASRTLGGLLRVERLAVALAQASLRSPKLVILQGGFDGLSAADANWLERVLAVLSERCRLMVSFGDLGGSGRHLVLAHEHVVLLFQGRVVAQGDPKRVLEPGSYLVTVTRQAKRLREVLTTQGMVVQTSSLVDDESTGQLLVSGARQALSDRIVAAAVEHEVPVIELLPVGVEPAVEPDARAPG